MLVQLFLLFGAGVASFLAPCVVALLPAYLGAVAGDPDARRGRPVVPVLAFVAGFSSTFAALGAAAGALGDGLTRLEAPLRLLGGAVLVVMGLRLLGVVGGRLAREWRPGLTRMARLPVARRPARFGARPAEPPGGPQVAPAWSSVPAGVPAVALADPLPSGASTAGDGPGTPVGTRARLLRPLVLGSAFAAGWTPCVGPVLAAALTAAATGADPIRGAALLGAYGVGLGTPFLIAALGIQAGSARRMAAIGARIEPFAGAILVLLGVLLLTDSYDVLASRLAGLAPQNGSA